MTLYFYKRYDNNDDDDDDDDDDDGVDDDKFCTTECRTFVLQFSAAQ